MTAPRPRTRTQPTRPLPMLVATFGLVVGLLAGCSHDHDATQPDPHASSSSHGTSAPLDVSVGTPVSIRGGIQTVSARITVAGQQDTVADLDAIGRAILAYRAAHGVNPPAYLVDEAGHPLVSWRVLLLPYLGQAKLYEQFDLTKPWDASPNEALLAKIPAVYRDRGATGAGAAATTDTSYAGVAGLKSVFSGGALDLQGGISSARVVDGDSMTTVVGPVGPKVAIPWTAPTDVTTPATPHLGDAHGFSGPGGTTTPMLFLDGTVRTLPDDVDPQIVHSWTSIASGSCAPPASNALQLHGAWDVDGDGRYDDVGLTVSLKGLRRGRHTVAFRVVEADGTAAVFHPTVTVR